MVEGLRDHRLVRHRRRWASSVGIVIVEYRLAVGRPSPADPR